jgi:hypothetical protein
MRLSPNVILSQIDLFAHEKKISQHISREHEEPYFTAD